MKNLKRTTTAQVCLGILISLSSCKTGTKTSDDKGIRIETSDEYHFIWTYSNYFAPSGGPQTLNLCFYNAQIPKASYQLKNTDDEVQTQRYWSQNDRAVFGEQARPMRAHYIKVDDLQTALDRRIKEIQTNARISREIQSIQAWLKFEFASQLDYQKGNTAGALAGNGTGTDTIETMFFNQTNASDQVFYNMDMVQVEKEMNLILRYVDEINPAGGTCPTTATVLKKVQLPTDSERRGGGSGSTWTCEASCAENMLGKGFFHPGQAYFERLTSSDTSAEGAFNKMLAECKAKANAILQQRPSDFSDAEAFLVPVSRLDKYFQYAPSLGRQVTIKEICFN